MALLEDGFSTTYTFASGALEFEEISVNPPGIDQGGEIDTTTMHNVAWRTRAAKKLKTLSEGGGTAAYDPAVYTSILAQIGVNQEITITWPDNSTLKFWGFLNTFDPSEVSEGERPEADFSIIPTNRNAAGVETAPVYAAAPVG